MLEIRTEEDALDFLCFFDVFDYYEDDGGVHNYHYEYKNKAFTTKEAVEYILKNLEEFNKYLK